jgi:hypothetical protein
MRGICRGQLAHPFRAVVGHRVVPVVVRHVVMAPSRRAGSRCPHGEQMT